MRNSIEKSVPFIGHITVHLVLHDDIEKNLFEDVGAPVLNFFETIIDQT